MPTFPYLKMCMSESQSLANSSINTGASDKIGFAGYVKR